MPSLVMFLLGIVTEASTGIAERVRAAGELVSLGYEHLVPQAVRAYLSGDSAASAPAPPVVHQAVPVPADAGVPGWVWVLLLVLAVIAWYLRPAITARLGSSRGGRSTGHVTGAARPGRRGWSGR